MDFFFTCLELESSKLEFLAGKFFLKMELEFSKLDKILDCLKEANFKFNKDPSTEKKKPYSYKEKQEQYQKLLY